MENGFIVYKFVSSRAHDETIAAPAPSGAAINASHKSSLSTKSD